MNALPPESEGLPRARSTDAIEETAARWLAQREEGFSTTEAREFDRWCRAHPSHAAAVARLEQACALLEKMPLVRDELQPVLSFPAEPKASAQPSPWRRRMLWLTATAAAAVVVATQWPRPPAAPVARQFATSAGGYERVLLEDGSTLELNANSAARVLFSAHERRVALLAGEAHFSVAHDKNRPFLVAAGDVSVRAVGTAFNVRLAVEAVEVLVTHGKVRISPGASPRAADLAPKPEPLVEAGQRVVVNRDPADARPRVESITPAALRQALSWQERKLTFAETPLHSVVAQFNARNRLQLVLGDATLAERSVDGTWAADNVEAFVRLLESAGDIVTERRGENEIVLRRAPAP
jgi:transmembrane sensor